MHNKTHDKQNRLPYQPEHYLVILTGLCTANWVSFALVALVFSAVGAWPKTPSMQALFSAIAAGYFAANFLLALALKYRGWLQKTPRKALNRLRQLTNIVLLWDAIHVLGLFDLFGGVQGPVAALLPVLAIISFSILPRTSAFLAGVLLVCGVAIFLGLQHFGILIPLYSIIDKSQAAALQSPLASALVLTTISMASLVFVYHLSRGLSIYSRGPKNLFDKRFNCFSLECWHTRLREELIRGRAQNSTTSVIIVGLKQAETVLEFDDAYEQLQELALAALDSTRQDLDTLSYIGDMQFALLLPTTTQDKCNAVVARIQKQCPVVELKASSSISPQTPRDGLLKSLLAELKIPLNAIV